MTTDTSLVVSQQRHLQLPDSCLFAPTELQIGSSISQTEFSRLGKALSAVDRASDLWACDYALAGQKRWGDEGLKLAATATKLSVGYLKTGARIAERFDPSRRFSNLTREHYRGICCFPVEFTDKWLPTVVEKGFGAKTLRALAVEAFGSDPKESYTRKQNKRRAVSIPLTLYAQFQERSPILKVAVFIEQILEDWLSTATTEQQSRVAAALLTREEANHQRRRAERNRIKAEKLAAKEAKAAARKAKQEAEASARAAFREAEKVKRDAERERHRLEREAAQAQRAAAREHAAECKKKLMSAPKRVRGIEPFYGACLRASKYKSMEEATAAAEKYTAAKGYDFEGFKCEKCKSFHIRVDEVKFEAARIAARAPRRAYAERRTAQWNPETKSYEADVL